MTARTSSTTKRMKDLSLSQHQIIYPNLKGNQKKKRDSPIQLIECNMLALLVSVYIETTPSTPQYPHNTRIPFAVHEGTDNV